MSVFKLVAFCSIVAGFLVTAGGVGMAQSGDFGDVPLGHTFYDEISWMAAQGITQGCDPAGTLFCPDQPVSRGQMAAFLARALQLPLTVSGEFDDVPLEHTFRTEIRRIADAGITQGCNVDGTLFCPDAPVSRQQMAAFLSRGLHLRETAFGDSFDDDDGSPLEREIEMLAYAGVTQGCNSDGTLFCPAGSVTRGQMAAFLSRGVPLIYWGEVTVLSGSGALESDRGTMPWEWHVDGEDICNTVDGGLEDCRGIGNPSSVADCVRSIRSVSSYIGDIGDSVEVYLVPPATRTVGVVYGVSESRYAVAEGSPVWVTEHADVPFADTTPEGIMAYGERGNVLGSETWNQDDGTKRVCNAIMPAA